MINTSPSCMDLNESGLLSVEQALQQILSAITVIEGIERLNIQQTVKRTLAETITSPLNVPPHANSAVDGYALRAEDLPTQGKLGLFNNVGTAFAGKPYAANLQKNQCIRIMTGAFVPDNANCVVMQEHTEWKDNQLVIADNHQAGQNIRLRGEDIQQGETVLTAGKLLMPADIGLLASLGVTEVSVKRRLKIAIASSGDELCRLGETLKSGQIYDSNRYSLLAALQRPDIEVIDLGILEDNPQCLLAAFKAASQYADVIISSGGVSVGDADHTKTALQQAGNIDFWKVAIKPGRPLAFGHIGESVFFGLPGNPVAVLVTFYQFVLPALAQLLGSQSPITPIIQARCEHVIRKRCGRTEIQRGILQQADNGEWTVRTTGKQGSGILRSMSLANCFIILEHQRETISAGETVNVQAFSGVFY